VHAVQRRLFHAEPSAVVQRLVADDHVGPELPLLN
jgi:hypothetical protein